MMAVIKVTSCCTKWHLITDTEFYILHSVHYNSISTVLTNKRTQLLIRFRITVLKTLNSYIFQTLTVHHQGVHSYCIKPLLNNILMACICGSAVGFFCAEEIFIVLWYYHKYMHMLLQLMVMYFATIILYYQDFGLSVECNITYILLHVCNNFISNNTKYVACFLLGNSSASEFYMPTFGSNQTFSHINTPTYLKPSHSSHLPACEDGTDSVLKHRHIKFRSRGITQKKAYNKMSLICWDFVQHHSVVC